MSKENWSKGFEMETSVLWWKEKSNAIVQIFTDFYHIYQNQSNNVEQKFNAIMIFSLNISVVCSLSLLLQKKRSCYDPTPRPLTIKIQIKKAVNC